MTEFDIHRFISLLREFYPQSKAPVVSLAAEKGRTPFEILAATLLSLRTKDDITTEAATRLFNKANTPEQISRLDQKVLAALIYPVGFYQTKAGRLREISRILLEKHQGRVPDTLEELLQLPGVGRKTANLVLIEGFKKPGLCVDTHVHRINNRVGYVATRTPEETEFALREKLDRRYWREYNKLLVAFGQTMCKPVSPFCSRCPVFFMCPRVGVTSSR
ncbi:MAG: endonuclease III [Desulfohalobiaceae bacterium]|nr:endonuclease III [Desulfohalobiaceae bacterium]